ncbi:MAG TPA: diguanylate cyclase [Syntrophaceticus sp.]|nr:diguanylate cyclase [Syntrophaceticus sp.]
MFNRQFFILSLIFFTLIIYLSGCSTVFLPDQPKAEQGILDLTQWQFEKDGVIKLDGQWEFYWNQLLESHQLKNSGIAMTGYISVPGTWNHYNVDHKELSGNGFATYRLRFITEADERLGLKIPRVFTSYKLYINGEQIASAGTVGSSRETMTPQYLPQIALFEPQPGENEIIIQVANYFHRSGGLSEALILGNEKQITGLRDRSVAYELFLFGSLIIIGIYHITLFFFIKKDKAPLYFGLFCSLIGIRTLLVGESFFIYLFPDFSWEAAQKFQTLAFYLGVPLIIMFFNSLFPEDFQAKITKIINWVGAGFACLVLLTPARIFTIFNPAFQLFVFIVIIYTIVNFIRIIRRKEKNGRLIILGGIALAIASLNDIAFSSIWLNDHSAPLLRNIVRTGNLSSVGQLIFVLLNSLELARKFAHALVEREKMTAQLQEINLNLDKLVHKRTKALEEYREQIENQKAELEKVNKALQVLSLKDPLTDLWNRRHYDRTIQLEWNRSLRHKYPLALMMIDIDNFKAYNDCYGHKAGDECLVKVAQTTQEFFRRASDLVVRYGGEEFVVIMPGLGKDEAVNMAQLLRKAIEELHIPHKHSSVSPWVTVSIGVTSTIPDMKGSPQQLFLAVDKALYEAKAAGRNQVKYLPMQPAEETDQGDSPGDRSQ